MVLARQRVQHGRPAAPARGVRRHAVAISQLARAYVELPARRSFPPAIAHALASGARAIQLTVHRRRAGVRAGREECKFQQGREDHSPAGCRDLLRPGSRPRRAVRVVRAAMYPMSYALLYVALQALPARLQGILATMWRSPLSLISPNSSCHSVWISVCNHMYISMS